MSDWQRIETAPIDNKRPLYLARFNESGELASLDFDGIWEYWEESWELAHINGWRWMSANGIEEPTHWAYQATDTAPPFENKEVERLKQRIREMEDENAELCEAVQYQRKELRRLDAVDAVVRDAVIAERGERIRALEDAAKAANG